jgi:hypothetical protein
MNTAKAFVIVVAAFGLFLVSAAAQAYDFANNCPPQAPPKWNISGQDWTQFVNSCVTNDAAATAGRAFDRPFWDKCIERCGLAADAEGRTPPTQAPERRSTNSAFPANPNWCSDVPASPPPPNFETGHPGKWAAFREMCMNAKGGNMGCGHICGYAEDLWRLQKSGRLNQPNTFPSPTDQPQGPFPLPGGGSGFILPKQPAPSVPAPSPDASESVDLSRRERESGVPRFWLGMTEGKKGASLRGDPSASLGMTQRLDAETWNRYRLRWREAVRGPSA